MSQGRPFPVVKEGGRGVARDSGGGEGGTRVESSSSITKVVRSIKMETRGSRGRPSAFHWSSAFGVCMCCELTTHGVCMCCELVCMLRVRVS